MALEFCEDTSPADWIVQSRVDWMRLITFGPAGFDTYARLRYLPDPTRPGQDEADAEIPDDHPSGLKQTRAALERLRDFTSTPDDCYFAVWEGFGLAESFPGLVFFDVPNRRFALLRGSLSDVADWETKLGLTAGGMPPAFAWPADHSWCFARDVDPHWAGIGAGEAAIAALIDDATLDVVRARPDEDQPTYYGTSSPSNVELPPGWEYSALDSTSETTFQPGIEPGPSGA